MIDHLGKVVEAGTRGSSGKEGNADTVLATLAEREITGAITNSRMAARKQRDGISGFEVPFTPEIVELGVDEDGDPVTALVLDWGRQQQQATARPRKSKVGDLLILALAEVVKTRGFAFQSDPGGGTVQACHGTDLREEFDMALPRQRLRQATGRPALHQLQPRPEVRHRTGPRRGTQGRRGGDNVAAAALTRFHTDI